MKRACLRFKRALAEYAAADQAIPSAVALAKHLAVCKACARELEWFRAAHRHLAESLTAEPAPTGFADATWARFCTSARHRRSSIATIALASAACAAMVAVVILAQNPRTLTPLESPRPTAAAGTTLATNNATGLASVKTKPGKSTSRAVLEASRSPQKYASNPAPIRPRRVRFPHNRQRTSPRKPINTGTGAQLASTSRTPPSRTQTISWDQMAVWYEYQGNYRSAAAAYEQAAREKPTEVRMFNAGRASECAGNVVQAVEYYARLLKHQSEQESRPRQDLPPRKGICQWNENPGSA